MKLGAKNLEWLFVTALILITITVFIMFGGGMLSSTPQTTLMVMSLFMVFAGEVMISIILLRIYDKIVDATSK